ncbi:hypothetical protein ACFYQA_38760, partial [Streptomyces sp. NPDC005774]
TENSGRAVGSEAGNPTARAVGIPLLQEGEEVKGFLLFSRSGRRSSRALSGRFLRRSRCGCRVPAATPAPGDDMAGAGFGAPAVALNPAPGGLGAPRPVIHCRSRPLPSAAIAPAVAVVVPVVTVAVVAAVPAAVAVVVPVVTVAVVVRGIRAGDDALGVDGAPMWWGNTEATWRLLKD